MKKPVLQMKYHPAKKEVEFRCFRNGQKVDISDDSKLMYYMNLKGKFVLQDYGNNFFNDITGEFEGLDTLEMKVITTKIDYEDFVQMVELYNAETEECKINPTLFAELPDMKYTFTEVKKYGEQALDILQEHRQKLFEIPLKNDNVKKSAKSFAKQIDEEIRNIREKIDSLSDNNVSLCFAGAYSSGKSALINAILGYRILPEDIKSETAKMFRVSSPKKGKKVKLKFKMHDEVVELEWSKRKNCFGFKKTPLDITITTEIGKLIDDAKVAEQEQYRQIKYILSDLNDRQEVASEIIVLFPVSLDRENLQFTIYDTPGTDSNYLAHQVVLKKSLEEQRQSILIFVSKPDGMEGSGNDALLNYLKAAEEKNSRTTIDMGRSLFVINKADGQTLYARQTLQRQEIKNTEDESLNIKLEDKKLFFTSAMYAYAAKAVGNGIATSEENGLFEASKYTLASEENPMGYCFRQNLCATSEYATQKMMEKCEEAIVEAKERNDEAAVLYICSGLYALENEILQYGEKYAATVKTYAIIDSIDRALTKLGNRANSLKDSNQEEIGVIEANIEELRKTINKAIEEEYENTAIPRNKPFPEEIRKQLKLDKETLDNEIVECTKKRIDTELKGWFFGLGKVRVKERDKYIIREISRRTIEEFTNDFLISRKELLEKQGDAFIKKVKKTIMENGKISDSAKKYFLDIPAPTVTQPDSTQEVEIIYDSHKIIEKIFVFELEHLDKEGFVNDIGEHLTEMAEVMSNDYSKEYRNSLEKILMQIKSRFELNLAEYSLHMKAMVESKDAMTKLGERVAEVAEALTECQYQLNKIIWKEIKKDS